MKLVIWSDYACPYCYIGEKRLEKALKEIKNSQEIEIEYRAFELDSGAPKVVVSDTATRFAKKYHLTPEEARRQIEHISKLGKMEGIDFRYASTRYTNTFDSHRLMKLALSKNNPAISGKVNELLFKAYFTDNLELAQRETLLKIGEEAGLEKDEIERMLESDEFAEQVREDEKAAAMRGVHGVPYFWVEGVFAIPGAVSVEEMRRLLEQALAGQNGSASAAHSCGPDGCVL